MNTFNQNQAPQTKQHIGPAVVTHHVTIPRFSTKFGRGTDLQKGHHIMTQNAFFLFFFCCPMANSHCLFHGPFIIMLHRVRGTTSIRDERVGFLVNADSLIRALDAVMQ